MCICSQGGNGQSKGKKSERSSPTAPSEGQKNPPAAHQNSPSNSGKHPEVCSNYASLNGNKKAASDCYSNNPGASKPVRCSPLRPCRIG
ncbi:hypothetical protein SLA2020_419540 [Shorea laevis]